MTNPNNTPTKPKDVSDTILVRLPNTLRSELKQPFGPIYTDTETLLEEVDTQLITVGDVVTDHCKQAGKIPDIAVIDGKTKRDDYESQSDINTTEAMTITPAYCPAGTLSENLIQELQNAFQRERNNPYTIIVHGEEDLATLPAILLADTGTSIVYGQPGEGIVHMEVTTNLKSKARDLISQMDGDPDTLLTLLSSKN
jgi:uncharacterized protein (UPF0218 family)